jgi:Fe2+ or Zn2+ uptake regulation protein
VYNTLNELVERGEVLALSFDGGPVLFDPNAGEAHHHFVCEQCGRIDDVRPEGLEQVRLPGGHRSDRMEVVFRGRCPACAAAVDSPAS